MIRHVSLLLAILGAGPGCLTRSVLNTKDTLLDAVFHEVKEVGRDLKATGSLDSSTLKYGVNLTYDRTCEGFDLETYSVRHSRHVYWHGDAEPWILGGASMVTGSAGIWLATRDDPRAEAWGVGLISTGALVGIATAIAGARVGEHYLYTDEEDRQQARSRVFCGTRTVANVPVTVAMGGDLQLKGATGSGGGITVSLLELDYGFSERLDPFMTLSAPSMNAGSSSLRLSSTERADLSRRLSQALTDPRNRGHAFYDSWHYDFDPHRIFLQVRGVEAESNSADAFSPPDPFVVVRYKDADILSTERLQDTKAGIFAGNEVVFDFQRKYPIEYRIYDADQFNDAERLRTIERKGLPSSGWVDDDSDGFDVKILTGGTSAGSYSTNRTRPPTPTSSESFWTIVAPRVAGTVAALSYDEGGSAIAKCVGTEGATSLAAKWLTTKGVEYGSAKEAIDALDHFLERGVDGKTIAEFEFKQQVSEELARHGTAGVALAGSAGYLDCLYAELSR